MAWTSFLKNLIGGDNTEVAETENATDTGAPRNENLSGRAFKKQLEATENAVLLDVRTAGEFAGGTIPGSKNIDFLSPAFSTKVKSLNKDATYFVFCRSGNRSQQAAHWLHSQGHTTVRHLHGGLALRP